MKCWCEINYHEIENVEQMLHERLWINSHIRIADKPVCYQKMIEKGVYEIIDVIDERTGYFYTYEEFEKNFATEIMSLKYHALIDAIPNKWKKMLKMQNVDLSIETSFVLDEIMQTEKVASYVYRLLNDDRDVVIKECARKWSNKLETIITEKQIRTGFEVSKLTTITKYQSFQYKNMHNIVFLNDRLYHFGKADSQICTFCKEQKEDFTHLFVNCKYVKEVWHYV